MDVERFVILFGEEGAKKVLAQIEELDKRLAAFAKKYVNDQVQAEVNLEKFRKRQISNLDKFKDRAFKSDKKRSRSLFEQENRQMTELNKRRKKYTSDAQKPTTQTEAGAPSTRRESDWERIKLLTAIYAIGRFVVGASRWLGSREKNARIYSGLYSQTGLPSNRAEAYDLAVRRMGGERGEGLKTLSSISSALGAMKYGDTSLIEVLGRFGIGGIHTGSSAEDVLRAVAEKASGMDAKSQQALFDALGLSDAQQLLIREAIKSGNMSEVFKDSQSIVEWSTKLQEAFNKQTETEDHTYKALVDATKSATELQKALNNLENKITDKFPNLSLGLSYAGEHPAETGIAALLARWGLKKAGIKVSTLLSRTAMWSLPLFLSGDTPQLSPKEIEDRKRKIRNNEVSDPIANFFNRTIPDWFGARRWNADGTRETEEEMQARLGKKLKEMQPPPINAGATTNQNITDSYNNTTNIYNQGDGAGVPFYLRAPSDAPTAPTGGDTLSIPSFIGGF